MSTFIKGLIGLVLILGISLTINYLIVWGIVVLFELALGFNYDGNVFYLSLLVWLVIIVLRSTFSIGKNA